MKELVATQRRLIVHAAHPTVGVRVSDMAEPWQADGFLSEATDSDLNDDPPEETREPSDP